MPRFESPKIIGQIMEINVRTKEEDTYIFIVQIYTTFFPNHYTSERINNTISFLKNTLA